MALCLQQRVETITGPIKVEIVAYRPDNRKRDLDNLLKAALDGMAKGMLYEDDSQIKDLNIKWADTIGGMLKIKIEVIQ
jgi:crossover junction endodeoxyribonuclease RusA